MIKENKEKNKVKVRELEIELDDRKGRGRGRNESFLVYIIKKKGNIEFYLSLDRIKKDGIEMKDYIEKIKQSYPIFPKNQEEFLKEIEKGKVLLNNEIYVIKKYYEINI